MKRTYLVDTHIWLWYAQGNRQRLPGKRAEQLTEWDQQGRLRLSVMSLWELGLLAAKDRIRLGCPPRDWVETFLQRTRFQIVELGIDAVLEANALPGGFHADPADRLIVATARQHGLTLITEDREILEYGARGYVQVLAPDDRGIDET